ncbi:hypothetical protein GQ53DRAFT_860131 [Thozetella sp. PMI_491]|nr:hypothetical protein GQ53DRAFT_860131 [Thozetella sp. PMI_491]
MEDLNTFLDLPSPSNSLQYGYGDAEQYLDTNTSESQSPINSPYDMAYMPDLNNLSNIYPSPKLEDEDNAQEQPAQQQKPAAKRKRENRYKNAPPSVLSRRRAQNRASQRAYRERKDQRIKDLEQMLNDAKQRNDVLSQAYASLHAEYVSLKTSQLKDYQPEIAYAQPPMNMTGNDRLDMDMYIYTDMSQGAQAGYSLQ